MVENAVTQVYSGKKPDGMWQIAYNVADGTLSIHRARKYITSRTTFKTRKDAEMYLEIMGETKARIALFGIGGRASRGNDE